MYSEDVVIKYSDLSSNGRASLTALLRIFQNAAINHSSHEGYSFEKLYERDRAWILISMNIEVVRYPNYNEETKVSTFTTQTDRIYGFRSYTLADSRGNELARAASLWAFVDTKTGRPSRIFEDIIAKYKNENLPTLEYIRREPPVGECTEIAEIVVGKRDIDTNLHVNNVRLAEFMTEALPVGCKIKRAQIFYRSASYEGDVLKIAACDEDGETGVKLLGIDDKVRSTAKFELF